MSKAPKNGNGAIKYRPVAEIATAYRDAHEAMYEGRLDNLDDNQVAAIVKAIKGPGYLTGNDAVDGEADEQRLDKLSDAMPAEADTTDNIVTEFISTDDNPILRKAQVAGKKLDVAFQETMVKGSDADLFSKVVPLMLADNISAHFTMEEVRDMPQPGTGTKDKPSNNPDIYKKSVIVNGEHKSKPASYYGDMWHATPTGEMQAEQLVLIGTAKEGGAKGSRYEAMGDTQRSQQRAKWQQRHNYSINNLRKAVRLLKTMDGIKTESGGKVVAEFTRKVDDKGDKTTELVNSTKPIVMYNAASPTTSIAYGINQFLMLHPENMKNQNLEGLLATKAKGKGKPKAGQGGAGLTTKLIPKISEAEDMMVRLGHAFQDEGFTQLLTKRMNQQDSDDLVLTQYKVYLEMHATFGPKGSFRKRADNLLEAESEANKVAAEAQSKGKAKGTPTLTVVPAS